MQQLLVVRDENSLIANLTGNKKIENMYVMGDIEMNIDGSFKGFKAFPIGDKDRVKQLATGVEIKTLHIAQHPLSTVLVNCFQYSSIQMLVLNCSFFTQSNAYCFNAMKINAKNLKLFLSFAESWEEEIFKSFLKSVQRLENCSIYKFWFNRKNFELKPVHLKLLRDEMKVGVVLDLGNQMKDFKLKSKQLIGKLLFINLGMLIIKVKRISNLTFSVVEKLLSLGARINLEFIFKVDNFWEFYPFLLYKSRKSASALLAHYSSKILNANRVIAYTSPLRLFYKEVYKTPKEWTLESFLKFITEAKTFAGVD